MTLREEIKALFTNPEDSYVIHFTYLEKEVQGRSIKKVIAIHAKNLNSTDSREFSIENFASQNDIPFDDLDQWFDDIELAILDEFNSFLKEKAQCNFIYWTEDDGQGLILDELKRIFEARNKAESQKTFKQIPTGSRRSIPYLFKFNEQEITLKGFIKQNNSDRLPIAFLTNHEEGACFEKREYQKIRASILCKIDFFIKVLSASKDQNHQEATKSSAVDIEGLKPIDIIKNMNFKSWLILSGIVLGLLSSGWGLGRYLNTTEEENLKKELKELRKSTDNEKSELNKNNAVAIDSINKIHEVELDSVKNHYQFKLDSISSRSSKEEK